MPSPLALPTRSPSPQVHSQASSNESPPPSHSPLSPERPHSAHSPCPPYLQPQPSSVLTGRKQRIPTPFQQSFRPQETPQRPLSFPSLLAAPALKFTHRPQTTNPHPPPTILSAPRDPIVPSPFPTLLAAPGLKFTHRLQATNPHPPPTVLPAPRDPTAPTPLALPTRSPSPQVHSQAASNESSPPSHSPLSPERPHSIHSPCPPYSQPQPSSALTGHNDPIATTLPQSSRPQKTPQCPLALPSLLEVPAFKCTHRLQATNLHPPPTVLSAPRDPTVPTRPTLPTRSPSLQVHSQAASNESPRPSHNPLGPERPHSALSSCPPYSFPQRSSALTHRKLQIPTPLP